MSSGAKAQFFEAPNVGAKAPTPKIIYEIASGGKEGDGPTTTLRERARKLAGKNCYNRAQLAGVGRSGKYERIGIVFGETSADTPAGTAGSAVHCD